MSGTAGLSSAKNRRSGNEVKVNGQNKSFPQPEQTKAAQPIARQASASSLPNPMEILKSHEFRLQKIEGVNMEQYVLNHKVDYLSFKTDFLTLKNDLLENKKISTCTMKTNTVDKKPAVDMNALQQRVVELNTLVSNMVKELTDVKRYIREEVEPVLVKVRMAGHVPAPAPALVPVTALAPVPALAPAIELITDETLNIVAPEAEPVCENIILSVNN
jgi:hypothetical protein